MTGISTSRSFAASQQYIKDSLDIFLTALKTDVSLLNQDYIPESLPLEMSTAVFESLMFSSLTGMQHGAPSGSSDFADVEFSLDEGDLTFAKAIEVLGNAVPLSREEYDLLSAQLRFRAFTSARLTTIDAINKARTYLVSALEEGKSMVDFIDSLGADELLQKTGFGKDPWYWENVYRTNIQTAYNTGRMMSFEQNEPLFLEFIGIDDSRQTEICIKRNNIIRDYHDPFWGTNIPPLHYSCRSTVRGIYGEEAEVLGLKAKDLPDLIEDPQKGFGTNPINSGSFWQLTPDMADRAASYGIDSEVKKAYSDLGLIGEFVMKK